MNTDSMVRNLNELKFGLKKENLKIFDDIIIYVRSKNISGENGEIILQELLDLFLHPDNLNKPISEIIGTTDYKKYLNSFIKEFKPKKLELIKAYWYLPLILLIGIPFYDVIANIFIDIIINKTGFNFSYNYTAGAIISTLIYFPFVFIFLKTMSIGVFKKDKLQNSIVPFFIIYAIFMVLIIIQVLFKLFFKDFSSIVLFKIPSIIILILGMLVNISFLYKIVIVSRRKSNDV
jgi:hypothetical protein